MKCNIVILIATGIPVATLGGVAFAEPAHLALRQQGETEKKPTPFNYQELEELEGKIDRAAAQIPRLLVCLEADDVDVRLLAAVVLGKIGAKAVDPVRARLTAKNADMRYGCLLALALIGKDAARAVDDVLARVRDDNADVRNKAVYTLGKLGVQSDAVNAALVKALDDGVVMETALEVFDNMDKLPKVALPTLAKLAKKAPEPVWHSAARVLAKAGAPAVPTFRELLKKTNVNERAKVIESMLPLGPEAKALTPELLVIVTEQIYPGGFIDANLLRILNQCGPDAAKGLAESLRARNKDSIAFIARESILKAIGQMRAEADAKASVPILIELLKENTPTHPVVEYRHLILEALGDIGPAAKAAIPVVESLTKPDLKGLTGEQMKASSNVAEVATVTLRRLGKVEKRGE